MTRRGGGGATAARRRRQANPAENSTAQIALGRIDDFVSIAFTSAPLPRPPDPAPPPRPPSCPPARAALDPARARRA